MKIGIVGWGVEGKSAYNFFGPKHEYLIVNEAPVSDLPPKSDSIKVQFIDKPRAPGVTSNVTDLSYLNGIENCDKIVYTPIARKNLEKLFPEADPFWQKATTIQHIFFEEVKTKNIIGVTGSKGKGTTSTLIAKMLEASGKKVHFGGNVGRAVLDFVTDVSPDDWVVLELANFQLYKFPYSPHIAVCLMLMNEHLDWHPDIDDYLDAKANIFRHQKKDDFAIYFGQNEYSTKIAQLSKGVKIPYYQAPGAHITDGAVVIDGQEIIKTTDVKLLGEHNLQNICAALTAVWQVSKTPEAIRGVLASFSGLEHRLEFVSEVDGVKYYDDSFGTTPDTAVVAMKAFAQPKIMILGGHDKGLPFDGMVEAVTKNNVRHVIAIGKTGPRIAKMLRDKGYNDITEGLSVMPLIVKMAHSKALAGDVVLLSTGCSSFGLFRDYKDRGNQFKKAVLAL